ncbi:MAG: OsmC family protein [Actinomycetota bacterium]|nr:OsmC family protein [Actinomycetota bacterium]
MSTDTNHRSVTVERTSSGRFTISNERDGQITIGTGGDADFTPTELLLAAIAGCTAIDVDIFTTRRSEPERFEVVAEADKIRDGNGNRLTNVDVTFDLAFPDGEGGDAARDLLPDAVQRSHDRLCTVGRSVELGTPIGTKIR